MYDFIYNIGLLFYNIAEKYQNKSALSYTNRNQYSYNTINQLSNQIARYLIVIEKLDKGDVLAIFNQKSKYGFATMLACLKTGIIYTNIDETNPWQRIEKALDIADPKLVLCDTGLTCPYVTQIRERNIKVVYVKNEFVQTLPTLNNTNLEETNHIIGSDPAYIMFTSGSTGFPKGVTISHSNLLNFVSWGKKTFSIVPEDIFTNVNPMYFDNSVFDFYVSLMNGASLIPIEANLIKNARELLNIVSSFKCTVWFSVPSFLVYLLTIKALKKEDFSSLKIIAFGGEGFPKSKLKKLYDLYSKRMTLFNVYGPTECTCICSSYIISDVDFENMNELAPLGFLSPNFTYKILPIEENNSNFGELCLIGPNVGLGYYNNSQKTLESFIYNKKPFLELMYKTGDIVEKRDNGYLYFKGRIDNQIKCMGYRIELEEIEAAFNSLTYVNEVGVIYKKINNDLGQIKAFVNLSDHSKTVSQLLTDIKNMLPQYMLPKTITILDALPKNQNGKLDRKQLI